MRILGIDPGYGIIGFGLVEGNRNQFQLLRCGAITTPAGMARGRLWCAKSQFTYLQ